MGAAGGVVGGVVAVEALLEVPSEGTGAAVAVFDAVSAAVAVELIWVA